MWDKNVSVVLKENIILLGLCASKKYPFYLSNVKVNSTRLHNKFIWRNKHCLDSMVAFNLNAVNRDKLLKKL